MAKRIVVTGSNGFIGKNLTVHLNRRDDIELREITRSTPESAYPEILSGSDVVFHLAGVNRPENDEAFFEGNSRLTEKMLEALDAEGTAFVLSSSIHATSDNPYGRSKREAEQALEEVVARNPICGFIYRLPGVFGKWSKPNYNSVVATFCHNIAHEKSIRVDDASAEIELVYIDDVIDEFLSIIGRSCEPGTIHRPSVDRHYTTTVGGLAEMIKGFRESRETLHLPQVNDSFEKKLYSTYLSYLPDHAFSYDLDLYTDDRGRLFEWIKSESFGQVFISDTEPGVTRGNHFHHTKTEKFLVIKGKAKIEFRKIGEEDIIEYIVSGDAPEVVDIPPGYTHSLTNIGDELMITLFWANELFDEDNPDTSYEEV